MTGFLEKDSRTMHKLFKKNQIFTIPNLLSVIRIAMIPIIVWLYSFANHYYAAIGVVLLSGATDIIDGWIARRFNMISDFGKALDPLADKLTQAALLLCLLHKYELLWALAAIFGVCEILKLIFGILVAKKCDQVNSAKWYGKLNTVIIYATMMLLILFPRMNIILVNTSMLICGVVMIITNALYIRYYCKLLKENKSTMKETR